MSNFALIANGVQYEGFKSATVNKSISSIAGTFQCEVTERVRAGAPARVIQQESTAKILLERNAVINGFVEKIQTRVTKDSRSIGISGRDKLADLIDCSVPANLIGDHNPPINFFDFAKLLCKPFGITVFKATSKSMRIEKKTSIAPGQSPFEVLEERARQLGVLLVGNGEGELVITEPGAESAEVDLIEGQQFKEVDQDYDVSQVYSDYQFVSQSEADDDSSSAAAEIEGKAKDNLAKRYRLLIQPAGTAVGNGEAEKLAQWEATVRRARSNRVTVTVATWYQNKNKIWRPNLTVKVVAPSISVNATMLIDECQYSVNTDGSYTVLTLVNKNAYSPKPLIESDPEGFQW